MKKLSAEIPAIFIAFDLLLWDGEPVHERPLEERRAELLKRGKGFWISPAHDRARRGHEPGSTASRPPGSTA